MEKIDFRCRVINNTGINLGGRKLRIKGGKKRNSCIVVDEFI